MKILHTSSIPDARALPLLERLAYYNGLDCCLVLEIHERLNSLMDPISLKTYSFMLSLQGPVLELMLNGTWIDPEERRRKIVFLEKQIRHLETVLSTYSLALWNKPFNAGSWQQKAAFFYTFLQIPPIKQYDRASGEMKITTNAAAMEKIRDTTLRARPIALAVLAYQDAKKALGTLKSALDPDGYFRSSYNIAGTETGRFSSKKNCFGRGCFPPGAECLTPTGWIPLEEVEEGQIVLQATPTVPAQLSWACASPISLPFSGTLFSFSSEQTAFTVTPDHRILTCNRKTRELSVWSARKAAASSEYTLPISGAKVDGDSFFHPLLIALISDGTLERTLQDGTSYWRISLKKERKIERFLLLAELAEIPVTEINASEGYRRFSLHTPSSWPTDYGTWLLSLSPSCGKRLLNELKYWDGNARGNSTQFHTSRLYRAKWIQTLAHLHEHSATITTYEQPKNSYSTTRMYKVNIKPRDYAHVIPSKHTNMLLYEGPVFCISVPSHFFLCRWENKVFITGNSNDQNWNADLRSIFAAPEGPFPEKRRKRKRDE